MEVDNNPKTEALKEEEKTLEENEKSIDESGIENGTINKEDASPEGKSKRHRRSKNDSDGRIFQCPLCDKCYLSAPALTSHRKLKHSLNTDGGSGVKGRGRPRKDEIRNYDAEKYKNKYLEFFNLKIRMKAGKNKDEKKDNKTETPNENNKENNKKDDANIKIELDNDIKNERVNEAGNNESVENKGNTLKTEEGQKIENGNNENGVKNEDNKETPDNNKTNIDENKENENQVEETINSEKMRQTLEQMFNQLKKKDLFKDINSIENFKFYSFVVNNWDKENPDIGKECICIDKIGEKCNIPPMDGIFFKYLKEVSLLTNESYFWFITKFIVLLREYINTNNKNKIPEEKKDMDYTQIFNSEYISDYTNDFYTEFMEPNKFYGMHSDELKELVFHFCYWLFKAKYSTAHVILYEEH